MMRKNLWMFAAILICGAMAMLTGCSVNDNFSDEQPQNEVRQKAEMKKSLLGLQVDLSDILAGGDDISFWNFMEDGTFEVQTMSMVDVKDSEEDSLALDVFKGKWEVFANAENPWFPASEKLSGFKATLDVNDEELAESGLTPEDLTMTYYAETAVDENGESALVMLNSAVMDYLVMSDYEGNDGTKGMTRGFTGDIFEKQEKTIVNNINPMKEQVGTNFRKIFLSDAEGSIKYKNYRKIYRDSEKILNQMRKDNNATKTNYAEWMSEIYTKKGKNPRICDMNIPGTHDTFTGYFYERESWIGAVRDGWVCTQLTGIPGQWNAGARVFDFRLDYNDDKDKQFVGVYHTLYLYISFDEALQEVVNQLKLHPGETAIASLSLDGNVGDGTILKQTQDVLKKYVDAGWVVVNPSPDVRLNDCKGKMIIIYSYHFGSKRNELYGPMLLIGRGGQYSESTLSFLNNGKTQDIMMTYQNLYEMSSVAIKNAEFWQHKREVFETCFWEFQKFRNRGETTWSWNQLNAYIGSYVTMSYSQNAEVMHPWASNFVAQQKNYALGIITMDFFGSNEKFRHHYTNCELLPKLIIETNRYQ